MKNDQFYYMYLFDYTGCHLIKPSVLVGWPDKLSTDYYIIYKRTTERCSFASVLH
jgi:hypothetical protein